MRWYNPHLTPHSHALPGYAGLSKHDAIIESARLLRIPLRSRAARLNFTQRKRRHRQAQQAANTLAGRSSRNAGPARTVTLHPLCQAFQQTGWRLASVSDAVRRSQAGALRSIDSCIAVFISILEKLIMKKLSLLVALSAALLGAPVASFAQTSGAPANVETAQSVPAQAASTQDRTTTGSYGGTASGSSAAGFGKHAAKQACVGPVSFCNIYFGS